MLVLCQGQGCGILLVVRHIGFHPGFAVLQVTRGGAVVSLLPVGGKLRDGDGRQDADDRDDDQELDEGEAFSVSELV